MRGNAAILANRIPAQNARIWSVHVYAMHNMHILPCTISTSVSMCLFSKYTYTGKKKINSSNTPNSSNAPNSSIQLIQIIQFTQSEVNISPKMKSTSKSHEVHTSTGIKHQFQSTMVRSYYPKSCIFYSNIFFGWCPEMTCKLQRLRELRRFQKVGAVTLH